MTKHPAPGRRPPAAAGRAGADLRSEAFPPQARGQAIGVSGWTAGPPVPTKSVAPQPEQTGRGLSGLEGDGTGGHARGGRSPGGLAPTRPSGMTAPGEHLSKTHAAVTGDRSALARYQDVVVGHRRLLGLAYFELCLWLAGVPGALGLMLREVFWPRLFHSCGKKVYFGSNVTLMHPNRIAIGDRAVIGNGCVLDARNPSSEVAITIGSDVMLSQGVMLSCKNAIITLGERVGMGPYTVVQATNDDPVLIDDDAVIAAHCYIAGG